MQLQMQMQMQMQMLMLIQIQMQIQMQMFLKLEENPWFPVSAFNVKKLQGYIGKRKLPLLYCICKKAVLSRDGTNMIVAWFVNNLVQKLFVIVKN